MKFKKSILLTGTMYVIVISCQMSCNVSDASEIVNKSAYVSTNDALDLFAQNHENLWVEAKYGSVTRSSASSTIAFDESIMEQMDENVQDFLSKNDIFADLTPSQKAGLVINEDSVELMRLDPDVYIEYAEKHKSAAFNEILYQILKKNRMDYNSDDIINNAGLYLNEKVHLMLILPSLHSTVKVGLTRAATTKSSSKESSSNQKCLEEYESAKRACLIEYLVSCGISLATSGGIPIAFGTGVGWATFQYFECEENAHTTYVNCLK